jgi:hypothetical protein
VLQGRTGAGEELGERDRTARALSSAGPRYRFGNARPGSVMPSCRNGIDPVNAVLAGPSGSRADRQVTVGVEYPPGAHRYGRS